MLQYIVWCVIILKYFFIYTKLYEEPSDEQSNIIELVVLEASRTYC